MSAKLNASLNQHTQIYKISKTYFFVVAKVYKLKNKINAKAKKTSINEQMRKFTYFRKKKIE